MPARCEPISPAPTSSAWPRPSRGRTPPTGPWGSSRPPRRSSDAWGSTAEALARYAGAGQGREIQLDPGDPEVVRQVWSHDIAAAAFPTPIWPWLLLLAMILVPIDVGVRRVALTRGDFSRARGWVVRRVGLARPIPEAAPGLAELRAARGRSQRRADRAMRPRERKASGTDPAASATSVPPPASASPAPPPVGAPHADGSEAEPPAETLTERLARRRREGR